MTISRREALGSLSAFALLGSLLEAQTGAPSSPSGVTVFKLTDMPAVHKPSGVTGRGGMSRDILPQGDLSEMHVTSIDAGKVFGPMNKNANFNFRLIIEGKMTIQPEAMPALTAGPGDIVYSPANTTAQVSNSGDSTLTYFVVELKPKPASS